MTWKNDVKINDQPCLIPSFNNYWIMRSDKNNRESVPNSKVFMRIKDDGRITPKLGQTDKKRQIYVESDTKQSLRELLCAAPSFPT